jgi:uncharacterized protein with HEPN domain
VPPRAWVFRVRDILEAISRVVEYTAGMSTETFAADNKTIDAVVRNFIVLGEAAKHVPDDMASRYPEIPWSMMAGMRDMVVHENFGVSLPIIWETVRHDLPPLVPLLQRVILENDGG